MNNPYQPKSYFFAELSKLKDIVSSDFGTDAFGPVSANQYRTTAIVTSDVKTKVFAICDGRILIQPSADSSGTKVNLILKPKGGSYAPLNIKYFVYRGVNIEDLIEGTLLKAKNLSDANQPLLLQKIWDLYINYKLSLNSSTGANNPPTTFPASLIGYDPTQSPDLLLEYYFSNATNNSSNFFQLPDCKAGDYIGNFSAKMGLDIVLDQGDYKLLNNPHELLKLDLGFSRNVENVLDVTNISSDNTKRYKQNIFQFLDTAAFWGSHINCGEIKTSEGSADVNNILKKYQTSNKVYIYIQAEKGRSYNYFDLNRSLFQNGATLNYDSNSNGWPILILDQPVTNASNNLSHQEFALQYHIANSKLPARYRNGFINILSANGNDTTNFPQKQYFGDSNTLIDITGPIVINFPCYNNVFCSTFLFIYCFLNQEFPVHDYFKDIWPGDMVGNFDLTQIPVDALSWCHQDINRVADLTLINGLGASVQNVTYFDTGKSAQTGLTTRRRLFAAIIKDSTDHVSGNKINVDTIFSGYQSTVQTKDQYFKALFNRDIAMSIYRGQFSDGHPIYSLALVHDLEFSKKQSYFFLGITESEYNKLFYDNPIGPTTPPASPPHMPTGADNLFLHLKALTSSSSEFKKFNLGMAYEKADGTSTAPIYPSSGNAITIYTLDGHFFFSEQFSEYQIHYNVFSDCSVNFRPNSISGKWDGGYGFDWIRVGDTNLSKDSTANSYVKTIGKYYDQSQSDTEKAPSDPHDTSVLFKPRLLEYFRLLNYYPTYPLSGLPSMYSASAIYLYPSTDQNNLPTQFPKLYPATGGTLTCLTEARLDLKIQIPTPKASLQLKFEGAYFEIIPLIQTDLSNARQSGIYSIIDIIDKSSTNSVRVVPINLKCIKEFAGYKTVRVIADGLIAGELIIQPNEKLFRKNIKLAFVNVKTRIDNHSTVIDGLLESSNTNILIQRKILNVINQVGLDIADVKFLDLDLTQPVTLDTGVVFDFNTLYVKDLGTSGASIDSTKTSGIHRNLGRSLEVQHPTTNLQDYCQIFFFGQHCKTTYIDANQVEQTIATNGASEGHFSKFICVYYDGIHLPAPSTDVNDTTSHELLHSVGLDHPFDDNAQFTFMINTTENIMDYVVNATEYRFSMTLFQRDFITHPDSKIQYIMSEY